MKQAGMRGLQLRRGIAAFLGSGLMILTAATGFAQEAPQRDVFFGETHVHTSWSFDAYIFGNTKTGPADAYRYAIGEAIEHPLGYKIQITHPLDWMGVTDHSEYIGTVRLANDPNSPISKLPIAEKLKVRDQADIQRIYLWLGYTVVDNKPIKELVDPQVAGTVWKEVVATADQFNKPGKFTAFCAYEWTSTPDNRNMHRNVFFKDCAKVPRCRSVPLTRKRPRILELDGHTAPGRQRAAGDRPQCEPERRHHVPDGGRFQGPADRRRVGRGTDAQRAAAGDQADQGQSETTRCSRRMTTSPTLKS